MSAKPLFLVFGALALVVGGVGLSGVLGQDPAQSAIGIVSKALAATATADQEAVDGPLPIPEPRIAAGGTPFHDIFPQHDKARWKISHGWRNGAWTANDWRRSQVGFDDGLTITLERKPSAKADFAGGEVQSRKWFGHGYYEVRMRAAKGSGTVSAFFTYTGPPFGQTWNEIDVEILGRRPREVMLTYYRDGKKIPHIHKLDFDTTEGFHTYAFDWQPEHLRWYVDGELVHEASPRKLALPRLKQKLMASLWGSETLTSWVGPFDTDALPTQMDISCISYASDYASRTPCEPKP